ncbi:MAG TPA: MASE1 domain-containing protein [Gemmatimonadales bacterium]|nr:MASE1 domain-containing protein [Gemmatimonadales bacterium]
MIVSPSRALRPLVILGLTGLGNYLCALAGYGLIIRPAGIALVWPASGFLLALLILSRRREWVWVLAGAWIGNAIADRQHSASVLAVVVGATANSFESLVAALVVRRIAGRLVTLERLRDVWAMFGGAVLLSNAFTALVGDITLHGLGGMSFWLGWLAWWAGDGMGMLLVGVPILAWAGLVRARHRLHPSRVIEGLLVTIAIGVLGYATRTRPLGGAGSLSLYPYLPFPLLLWAGVRLGPAAASTAVLMLAAVTELNAARGLSPFGQGATAAEVQVLEMYLYLGLASLSALAPAATLGERRAAEEKLRSSERRFRQMAEHIAEAFFVVEVAGGQILYVSPTWGEIWGRPMSEAYDPQIWFKAIHPDDQAALATDREAIRQGHPTTSVFRVVRPDGGVRWVRGRAFPVRDDRGAVYRMVGVSEDITALRQSEDRLAQAQKLEGVGQLAGGIAHDFNNLLTVILSHTELLLTEAATQDPKRHDLETIGQAARSAAQLTRQLLLFSRKEVLRPEVLRLSDLITNVGKMLKRLIGEHIELATVLDPAAGSVRADPGSLEQVVVNLSVNARDAMPDGGKLLIEVRNVEFTAPAPSQSFPCPAGRYVSLVVSDTGTGMDDATKARAFEPFFTTKGPGKGTGLGLATVYGVVRQSEGYIVLESEPGKGTSFTIYLPRVDTPAAPATATVVDANPRGTETILLVEDDASVRSLIQRLLVRLGYQVLVAPNGALALDLAATHQGSIHLLMTDVIMPGMSGRVLADRFAVIRPDARVLYMSGYTDDAIVHHGVLTARMAFLQKPVTPAALARRVREVLDKKALPA